MSVKQLNENFDAQFIGLSMQQKRRLCLNIVRRLQPDYTQFMQQCGADAGFLTEVVEALEQYSAVGDNEEALSGYEYVLDLEKAAFQEMISKCNNELKHDALCAFYACEATHCTVLFFLMGEADLLEEVVSRLLLSAHQKAQKGTEPLLDEADLHPLVAVSKQFLLN